MTVAESLKRFRKDFRLKQKDVAKILGISQQAYQVYESKSMPSAAVIIKLADAFNVSTDYLLGRCDLPTETSLDRVGHNFIKVAIDFQSALQNLINAHTTK